MIRQIVSYGVFFLFFVNNDGLAQHTDIGVYYAHFWSPYKYRDYGNGFINQTSSNSNFSFAVSLNRYSENKLSWEFALSYIPYNQYYSTRKAWGAYESVSISGNIGLRKCYSFIKNKKFEARIKGGVSIGFAGFYETEYTVMRIYPVIDSITRGKVKRNFTPVFPLLSFGTDISYRIAKRFKISIAANYQKGLLRITEFDIYYNNGSGNNDQRAKQWGTGDYYGLQFGLRFLLKDNKGEKRNK